MQKKKPNYQKIYRDIITQFNISMAEEESSEFNNIIGKKELNSLDVICLNEILFSDRNNFNFNQKLHNFDKNSKEYILEFQKKYRLNNSETANYFKISRNTLAKWKCIDVPRKTLD